MEFSGQVEKKVPRRQPLALPPTPTCIPVVNKWSVMCLNKKHESERSFILSRGEAAQLDLGPVWFSRGAGEAAVPQSLLLPSALLSL